MRLAAEVASRWTGRSVRQAIKLANTANDETRRCVHGARPIHRRVGVGVGDADGDRCGGAPRGRCRASLPSWPSTRHHRPSWCPTRWTTPCPPFPLEPWTPDQQARAGGGGARGAHPHVRGHRAAAPHSRPLCQRRHLGYVGRQGRMREGCLQRAQRRPRGELVIHPHRPAHTQTQTQTQTHTPHVCLCGEERVKVVVVVVVQRMRVSSRHRHVRSPTASGRRRQNSQ